MTGIVRRRQADEGAAAVEFALIVPVLVVLIFGIIQFGFAFNAYQGLHAAAREGARLASLSNTTQTLIQTRVAETRSNYGGVLGAEPTVEVSPSVTQPCQGRTGQPVTVTVSAPITINIPIFGQQTKAVVAKGVFRCE